MSIVDSIECGITPRLTPEKSIVLVVDVQALSPDNEITAPLVMLIRAMDVLETTIIWTEHCPDKIGGTSIPRVKEALEKANVIGPIAKTTFSVVDNEEFCRVLLKRIEGSKSEDGCVDVEHMSIGDAQKRLLEVSKGWTVIMAGSEPHVCMYQTARGLRALGFEVEVVVDASTSRKVLYNEIGYKRCEQMGARLTTAETCTLEMLKDCNDKRWRKIFRIYKDFMSDQ